MQKPLRKYWKLHPSRFVLSAHNSIKKNENYGNVMQTCLHVNGKAIIIVLKNNGQYSLPDQFLQTMSGAQSECRVWEVMDAPVSGWLNCLGQGH